MTPPVRGGEGRPAISVVVPFFDSVRHLAACVEALLTQHEAGTFEILLVDNGSKDGSTSVASRYPALTLLEERTPGAYAARNAGIRRARAPIIAFTDADCVADRHWLRSIRHGMQDEAIAILIGRCLYPPNASPALRMLAAYENVKARYVTERCAPAHHFAYANNMAVRASVFDEIGLFKEWGRAADTELVHRLAAARPGRSPAYQPSMVVTHMEFLRGRDRVRRLSLYTQTNSQIDTFRELGAVERLGMILDGLWRHE